MTTFSFNCVTSFYGMKNKETLNYFQVNCVLDQAQIWQRGLFLGLEFKFIRNFHLLRHFDVIMMKRQNTQISKTEKVYEVIMKSF